jgi:uncharacterized protein
VSEPEPTAEVPPAGEPAAIVCWRCGNEVSAAEPRCIYCAAPLNSATLSAAKRVAVLETQISAAASQDASKLLRVLVVYGVMLGASVVGAMIIRGMGEAGPKKPSNESLVLVTVAMEAVDTVLTAFALLWVGVRWLTPRPPLGQRALSWALAPWLVLAALAINLAYHSMLRDFLRIEWLEESPIIGWGPPLVWVTIICFQPAIIEELFFRYLALGALRPFGMHLAVFISSVMFALAHVFVPLSVPILFLLGLILGYSRALSGSILLPMALHFAHNLAVIAFEQHWWGL